MATAQARPKGSSVNRRSTNESLQNKQCPQPVVMCMDGAASGYSDAHENVPLKRPADLPKQFGGVPGSGMQGYVCRSFPNQESPTDRIICSLIQVAVLFPIKIIVERMFEVANRVEHPHHWLTWCAVKCKRAPSEAKIPPHRRGTDPRHESPQSGSLAFGRSASALSAAACCFLAGTADSGGSRAQRHGAGGIRMLQRCSCGLSWQSRA